MNPYSQLFATIAVPVYCFVVGMLVNAVRVHCPPNWGGHLVNTDAPTTEC
jgi:hypothetical protein